MIIVIIIHTYRSDQRECRANEPGVRARNNNGFIVNQRRTVFDTSHISARGRR